MSAVNDGAGPLLVLGDNSTGAEAEVGFVEQEAGWQDHPLGFFDHVAKFLLQEQDVLFSRLVWAAFEAGQLFSLVPWLGVHCHWDAMGFAMGDQMAGLVWWAVHCAKVGLQVAVLWVKVCPCQGGFKVADRIGNEAVKFVGRMGVIHVWHARRGCAGARPGVKSLLGCWFRATSGEKSGANGSSIPGQSVKGSSGCCHVAGTTNQTKQWNQGNKGAHPILD